MTPPITRDEGLPLETIEAAAWRSLAAHATPEDHAALGLATHRFDGAFALTTARAESLHWNRAWGVGLHEAVHEGTLATLSALARGRETGFAVPLCPFALPADADRMLEAAGFGTFFHHLKWTRDDRPAEPVTTGLRVRTVAPDEAAAWGALAARLLGESPAHGAWLARSVARPGWSHHWACDGDTPVAVGALYHEGAHAWLGLAATDAAHRRRGAQGALLAQRIDHARAQGVRTMTLETGPDWADVPGEALRNARRTGFRAAYERPVWLWTAV
jgi:GNAT superfamily N-acetyltransferase